MKRKSAIESSEEFRRPLTLPKILDGKFYSNIQPHPKTPGGIQATCTSCFGTISGTTKSTGNFLSHIKRRHKEILPSCQLYCSAKNLSCFNQSDLKFGGHFPLTLSSPSVPMMLGYPSSGGDKKVSYHEQSTSAIMAGTSAISNSNIMPAVPAFLRSDSSSSSNANNNPANGVFKQSPPSYI